MLVLDASHRIHRIVTLVMSDEVETIENAFWLLQEKARRDRSCATDRSVLSVLPYFHPKLGVSRLARYFYARADGPSHI